MDVANDPGALAEMQALGAFQLPVVRIGDRWVRGVLLNEVAKLLGIEGIDETMLPAAVLSEKLDAILAAAQRYVLAFPRDKVSLAVPGREKRNVLDLAYHIFAVPISLVEAREGDVYLAGNTPRPDEIATPEQIAAYGDTVRATMRDWFSRQDAASLERILRTTYGARSIHHYLERTAWHAGQHSRQLAEMMRLAGSTAPDELPASFFTGLPIPEKLWI